MVEVVGSVTPTQSTTLKQSAQSASVSATVQSAPAPAAQEQAFVSSSIRVDNLQNVAILEYRSSETGEVVQQYPNQSQIDAFKRAEHLSEKSKQAAAAPAASPSETKTSEPSAAAATPAQGSTSVSA